jgi:flagellar hook-basal body complex protein FliE
MQISATHAKAIAAVEPLTTGASPSRSADFSSILQSAIQRVEGSGNAAASAVDGFLSGDGGELHSTILATQRASLEFDMFLQVRNKVVQAYQEVMRMQL